MEADDVDEFADLSVSEAEVLVDYCERHITVAGNLGDVLLRASGGNVAAAVMGDRAVSH